MKKLKLILIITLITLVISELAIRLVGPKIPTPFETRRRGLDYDQTIFGFKTIARKSQRVEAVGPDLNKVSIEINSLGYRGKEVSAHKEKNFVRILIVGGSAVFDIFNSTPWSERLESKFREGGFANVEVINGGAPGRYVLQEHIKFVTEDRLLNPDIVLLVAFWNELVYLQEDYPFLRRKDSEYGPDRPFLLNRNPLDGFLSETSALYLRARQAYFSWLAKSGQTNQIKRDSLPEVGFEQMGIAVESFLHAVKLTGATPVLAFEPTMIKRANSPQDHFKINRTFEISLFPNRLTDDAIFAAITKARNIFNDVSARQRVKYFDLQDSIGGREEYFFDAIHLSDKGSSVMADEVFRRILPLVKELSVRRSATSEQ